MSPTLLNTFIPEILCQPFDLILEDIDLQFVHDVTTDGTFEFIAPPLTRKPVLPTHLGKDHCSEFPDGDYWDYHGFACAPPPLHAPIDTATG